MKNTEKSSENKKKNKIFLYIAILLFMLALLAFIFMYLYNNTTWFNKNFGVLDTNTFTEIDINELPKDSLFITETRREYKSGTMYLIVPKLNLDTPVAGDTLPTTLLKTPGLYEYAQMPGEGDVNTSIAGHRDLGEQEFYYLDNVVEGDNLYVVYNKIVYKYKFENSKVVKSTEWDIISRQGFSALTLTTCDPIGTNLNRLVVVGSLVEHYPLTDDIVFE